MFPAIRHDNLVSVPKGTDTGQYQEITVPFYKSTVISIIAGG